MSESHVDPSELGPATSVLGFIGLGVMGEPMCGHLARRSGIPVLAHDLRNYLGPLNLRMELLRFRAQRDNRAEDLQDINATASSIRRL